jgi:hypothetical protein
VESPFLNFVPERRMAVRSVRKTVLRTFLALDAGAKAEAEQFLAANIESYVCGI